MGGGRRWAGAGDDLGGVLVEFTSAAGGKRGVDDGQSVLGGNEGGGGGFRRLRLDHSAYSGCGLGDKGREERHFGEVLPIAHRHFRAHGGRVEPRWVVDAGEIGAPESFECVIVRRGFAGQAGGELELFVVGVPGNGAVRGQNATLHRGKPLGKEGRGELQNAMVRLVPGDEVLFAVDGASLGAVRRRAQSLGRMRREGV